jgi:hypothetical protein
MRGLHLHLDGHLLLFSGNPLLPHADACSFTVGSGQPIINITIINNGFLRKTQMNFDH